MSRQVCRTPGATYRLHIASDRASCSVEFGREVPLTAAAARAAEDAIHDAVESVLAEHLFFRSMELIGSRTVWFTPDGDGWPTRDEALAVYAANNGGRYPAWVQRVDEHAHEPEIVALGKDGR